MYTHLRPIVPISIMLLTYLPVLRLSSLFLLSCHTHIFVSSRRYFAIWISLCHFCVSLLPFHSILSKQKHHLVSSTLLTTRQTLYTRVESWLSCMKVGATTWFITLLHLLKNCRQRHNKKVRIDSIGLSQISQKPNGSFRLYDLFLSSSAHKS